MVIPMNNIKTINRNIKTIKATGAKLDALVHETGVLCLAHAAEHGNTTPIADLLGALNAGYRVKGFTIWLQMFSPVRVNGDGKVGMLKPENKNFTPFDLDEAAGHPFWTLDEAAERKVEMLSPEALKAIITRFVGYVNAADVNGEIHNKEGVLVKKIENVVEMKAYVDRIAQAA